MSNSLTQSTSVPQLPHVKLVVGICLVVLAAGLVLQPQRALSGILTAGVYGAQISIGALVFTTLLVITGAKWWRPVRPDFLTIARTVAVPGLVVLLVAVLGLPVLYKWAAPGAMDHNHLLHGKIGWLNKPFFIARVVAVIGIWLLLVKAIGGAVERHMARPTVATRTTLTRLGALGIVLLGLTISVAFWDWTMSLEPEWFSNMYGVYGFAGALQGGIAAAAALSIYNSRKHPERRIGPATLHDYGKLLFGFSMFWAYIWFCQYMLIWYANLPEEVTHYITRGAGGWGVLYWLNPIVSFVIPFLVLLSARAKKKEAVLLQVSIIVLIGRWIDIFMLVEPSVSPQLVLPLYGVVATICVVAAMLLVASRRRRSNPASRATS